MGRESPLTRIEKGVYKRHRRDCAYTKAIGPCDCSGRFCTYVLIGPDRKAWKYTDTIEAAVEWRKSLTNNRFNPLTEIKCLADQHIAAQERELGEALPHLYLARHYLLELERAADRDSDHLWEGLNEADGDKLREVLARVSAIDTRREAVKVSEAAYRLGLGTSTFRRTILPELRGVRRGMGKGRSILIPVSELRAWLFENSHSLLKIRADGPASSFVTCRRCGVRVDAAYDWCEVCGARMGPWKRKGDVRHE